MYGNTETFLLTWNIARRPRKSLIFDVPRHNDVKIQRLRLYHIYFANDKKKTKPLFAIFLAWIVTWSAFFWDYSGIGILGIDGICILLGAIPFSEWTEYHSVHSAPDSRMKGMKRIRFTRNRQNTCSFGKFLAGNPTRPPARVQK